MHRWIAFVAILAFVLGACDKAPTQSEQKTDNVVAKPTEQANSAGQQTAKFKVKIEYCTS